MATKRKSPAKRSRSRSALMLRIYLGDDLRLGPGKIRLLELIGDSGSISAAGRAMGMSYRRAWVLVNEMNSAFRTPVVAAAHGGRQGGGATVTPFGRDIVERYHDLSAKAAHAAAPHIAVLQSALKRPG